MATIEINNLKSLKRKLDNVANIDIGKTMSKAVRTVHGEAKSLAPVGDTGDLAGSIRMSMKKVPNGIVGRIYTNLEYAPYVEFGTGIKGSGTYPYKIKGLSLSYKDKAWCYWDEKEEKFIFTKGQVAQPYMYPAINNNKKYIKTLFKEGVKDKLKDYCKGGK